MKLEIHDAVIERLKKFMADDKQEMTEENIALCASGGLSAMLRKCGY